MSPTGAVIIESRNVSVPRTFGSYSPAVAVPVTWISSCRSSSGRPRLRCRRRRSRRNARCRPRCRSDARSARRRGRLVNPSGAFGASATATRRWRTEMFGTSGGTRPGPGPKLGRRFGNPSVVPGVPNRRDAGAFEKNVAGVIDVVQRHDRGIDNRQSRSDRHRWLRGPRDRIHDVFARVRRRRVGARADRRGRRVVDVERRRARGHGPVQDEHDQEKCRTSPCARTGRPYSAEGTSARHVRTQCPLTEIMCTHVRTCERSDERTFGTLCSG